METSKRRELNKIIEARIKTLYEAKYPHSQIALEISKMGDDYYLSDGAVSARILRMIKHKIILPRGYAHRPKKKALTHNSKAVVFKTFTRLPLPDWEYIAKVGVQLEDLKNNQCRFPCKDGLYCGATADKMSYCAEHYAICYKPIPKKAA